MSMKVSIKNLKGEVFPVSIEETDSIATLKLRIQESHGDMIAERQKLIHAGKVLKDEQIIAELGLGSSDFIVCMITKEAPKKSAVAAPTAAPAVAAAAAAAAPVTAATSAAVTSVSTAAPAVAANASAAPAPAAQPAPSSVFSNESLQALVSMGFPESESRAALTAANGLPDLAYEFLITGIPRNRAPAAQSPSLPEQRTPATGIEELRQHPQFNMLKQLVQQNPAALSQVLDLIGQQNPALLQAIHENNDAFVAMMNEPIETTPPVPPTIPSAAPSGVDPAQIMQLLAAMPPAQRSQFAQQIGLSPQQLEGFVQMMSSIPPNELQAMLASGGEDPPGVIRLTEDEMAAVDRLSALGFSREQAAQAYLACDKNEMLAANMLLEGGWGDDDGFDNGGDFGHDHDDDNMYN